MKRSFPVAPKPSRKSRRRAAFTLIELLTVVTIIGMLSAISISVVRVSIETARTAQTETTIARIDSALTAAYEKYQYRRVDLTGQTFPSAEAKAAKRVEIMRDLLRCDFPCVPAEVEADSLYGDGGTTPLQAAYRVATNARFREDEIEPDDTEDDKWRTANAELLYLVVTNVDPESRLMFSDREVADTNGNGLFEFVDGWRRPICWLRWAPGLESSDRQPIADVVATGFKDGVPPFNPEIAAAPFDPKIDADPFDPLGVSDGWFLVPYVFSAGPDGEYGLIPPPDGVYDDPFAVNPGGAPGAPDGTKTHQDNVNNHTLVR